MAILFKQSKKREGIFVYSSHNPLGLLKQARPKFIYRNIVKGSIFSKYKYEKQGFGGLYTYYATPKEQEKLVKENSDMKLVEVIADKSDKLHPHYIFKKVIS